jgi:hypothetical protein
MQPRGAFRNRADTNIDLSGLFATIAVSVAADSAGNVTARSFVARRDHSRSAVGRVLRFAANCVSVRGYPFSRAGRACRPYKDQVAPRLRQPVGGAVGVNCRVTP